MFKLKIFLTVSVLLSLSCSVFGQQEGATWEHVVSGINELKAQYESDEGYKAFVKKYNEEHKSSPWLYNKREVFKGLHYKVPVDNLDVKKYLSNYKVSQYSNTSPYDVNTEETVTLTKNIPDFIRQEFPFVELKFVISSTPKSEKKSKGQYSYNACVVEVEYNMEGNTIKRTSFICCYYTIDYNPTTKTTTVRDFIKPCEVYPFTKLKKYNGVKVNGEEFLLGARYIELYNQKNPLSVFGSNIDKKIIEYNEQLAAKKAAELAAKKKAEEAARLAASTAKIDGKYYTKDEVLSLYQKMLNMFPVLPKSRPVTTSQVNGVTIKKEDTSVSIDSKPDYDGLKSFFYRKDNGLNGQVFNKCSLSSIVRAELALLPVYGDKSAFKIVDTRGVAHSYSEIEQHSFGVWFPHSTKTSISLPCYIVDRNTGIVFDSGAFVWFESKTFIKNYYKPIINERLSNELYFTKPVLYHGETREKVNDDCYVYLGTQFYKMSDASLWQLVRIIESYPRQFVFANDNGETIIGDAGLLEVYLYRDYNYSFANKDKVDYMLDHYKGVPIRIFANGGRRLLTEATIKGLVLDKGSICFDTDKGTIMVNQHFYFNKKEGDWDDFARIVASANTKTQEEIFNDRMAEIYSKYGKQTVMDYLSGNIKTGMSYDMMLELQKIGARLEDSYVKITDIDYYTAESGNKYIDVWLSNDTHFWIRNGVVTDVFYH